MFKKVDDFVNKYNISKKFILVAFSGGYDSTALLDILSKLRKKYDFKLFACHLNHNWRGAESDREELFCKNYCIEHNIEFFSKKLSQNSTKNELEARNARYDFFKQIYDEQKIDYLITAHTKSDNAETIIFRLANGMGIHGLKGISENIKINGMNILRPMINCSRNDIEDYIAKNHLTVNFDSSNKNKKYKRNKVRLDIIPHFKELNKSFEDNILITSKIAGFYDKSLDYLLEKLNIFEDNGVKTNLFLCLPDDIQYVILYKFLSEHETDINFKQISLLKEQFKTNIPKSGKYFSLGKNKFVLIKENKFEIIEKKDNNINEYSICISEVKENIKQFPNGTKTYIYANKSALIEPLKLRKRKDGDVFQPFGMQGKMKLKKFINSKHIPRLERDNLILLTNANDEILWIYPLATSEIVKVNSENFVRIDLKNEQL